MLGAEEWWRAPLCALAIDWKTIGTRRQFNVAEDHQNSFAVGFTAAPTLRDVQSEFGPNVMYIQVLTRILFLITQPSGCVRRS
jgi:hypothetical protein